ncbi:claudin-7-like [Synchiropus picturatus]
MAARLQLLGLLLGLVSWCLLSSCTSSHAWKVRSQAESLSSSQWQLEGLWTSCAATSLGALHCSRFKTVLGLPAQLQACRALMLLSLLLGFGATVLTVLGLKCTKMGGASETHKSRMVLGGGLTFLLSGSLTLIAVSWYAGAVIRDFYSPAFGGVRFELGSGVYLGWAASCLSLVGGSLLCSSCRRSSPPPRSCSYRAARPPGCSATQGPGQSIYTAAPPSDCSSAKAYV